MGSMVVVGTCLGLSNFSVAGAARADDVLKISVLLIMMRKSRSAAAIAGSRRALRGRLDCDDDQPGGLRRLRCCDMLLLIICVASQYQYITFLRRIGVTTTRAI